MRSRVVARFNGKEVPLGAFSASETVKGSERAWYTFALESQKQEHVSDVYGGGEQSFLIGTSGSLRKTSASLSSTMTSPILQNLMSATRILASRSEDSRMEQQ